MCAGADIYNVSGCACNVLGTCGSNNTCHCDSWQSSQTLFEGEAITTKSLLPVSRILKVTRSLFGQSDVYIGALECAGSSFDFPRHCEDVRKWKGDSGEYLIQPNKNVPPFLVYCDVTSYSGTGVTIISTSFGRQTRVNGSLPIHYRGASLDQVRALVQSLKRCYMPVKYDCRHSEVCISFPVFLTETIELQVFI